ncbi:DUF5079 family protein [Staphylococcus caeli]|uniref:Membrane protein n=1 Tax=Staphylococcus caeli TaxID=2201815 RepID=A0A1D4LIF2_9STAP|nr:DUF5079 family protein [Staphylococcus caeli]SCS66888.1 membrane protein [Staphylococcus caeli]SCS86010.1 membrane protein [Staphylococcus caeli]
MDNKEIQIKCMETIRNSYLIGFALVNFIIFGFYMFIYFVAGVKGQVPMYMWVYLVVSLLLWLLLYLQEKGIILKNYNKDNYKKRIASYYFINLLAGYNIPFLISSGYVFYFSGSRADAFTYWLIIAGLIVLSAIGLFVFCDGEFGVINDLGRGIKKLLGFILVLISFISLFYLSLILPVDSEENKMIWMGMIMLFCAHLLIARTYFFLAFLRVEIKEHGKQL